MKAPAGDQATRDRTGRGTALEGDRAVAPAGDGAPGWRTEPCCFVCGTARPVRGAKCVSVPGGRVAQVVRARP
jgi:hypothetical protein